MTDRDLGLLNGLGLAPGYLSSNAISPRKNRKIVPAAGPLVK